MSKRALILIISTFLVAFPFNAGAQDGGGVRSSPEESLLSPDLPKGQIGRDKAESRQKPKVKIEDISPQYLEEMELIFQECTQSDLLSTYYDCQCQAMRFLDERILAGPEVYYGHIRNNLRKECLNLPGIAGMSLGVCNEQMQAQNFKNYDKLCECFANTVARNFAKRPYLESRNIISLQRDAYVSCGVTDELVKRAMNKKGQRPSGQ